MVRSNMQKIRTVMADMEQVRQRPDAQPRSRKCFDAGYAGGISYFPRGRLARRRAAQQFARSAFAVDPGVRHEDAAGAEAGQRRAVDARTASSRR